MKILAIDPGPEQSAWLAFEHGQILDRAKQNNLEVLELVRFASRHRKRGHFLVIEKVECFGMAAGAELFETVFWSGRFAQAWNHESTVVRIGRIQIKNHLCHSSRAKDSNIRQALIDRFGGSKQRAIGVKAAPGPLYGISKDLWSALAIAVTYDDLR